MVDLSAQELSCRLATGDFAETLFDVRTPGEHQIARIEGGQLLDQALVTHIESLDRQTPLAFY